MSIFASKSYNQIKERYMKHKLFASLFAIVFSTAFFSCSSDDNSETPNTVGTFKVSGCIEKGPFVQGSKVTLYELEADLSQTGKSFKTQTNSDLGAFAFDSPIELNSQFVELETSGYFYNEVKGELSNSQITLNALSNVTNRNAVNVNLITHLEYGRVKKLVRDGMGFSAAKKQAEKELLACFAITEEISAPEGVSITDNNKNSSILLAISTVMLYNRSEAEFTEFISKFSTDFADNGLIDNAAIREDIKKGQENAHPSEVIERMKEFYTNKGVAIQCDDFSIFIDFNGDGVINDEDKEDISQNPDVVVIDDNIFSNKNNVYGVLNSCYAGLQQFINSQLQLEYIRTQKAAESAPWWSESLSSVLITSNTSLVNTAFSNAYSVINRVNMLIDHKEYILESVSDFAEGEGESLFSQAEVLRAFAFYNMAVLWGDIPLITHSYTIDEMLSGAVDFSQSSQDEVLDYVRAEVERAVPSLPDQYDNAVKTKCYFTRDAALMLLAEVTLTKGYKELTKAALSQINQSKYDATLSDASVIYNGDIANAQAVIFALTLEGHYQPLYTKTHYDLLLKEVQGETESLVSEWKESLCTEYGYWAALKRLGVAQSVTGCEDHELLMPFPSGELMKNPNLRQNPGY